jgi:hypothetical protein
MTKTQLPLATGLTLTLAGIFAGISLRPVEARFQDPVAVKRVITLSLTPSNRLQTPKAHWGIYALAEYRYSPSGKLTSTKRNDLLLEQDMYIGQGGNHTNFSLSSGEYEIHVQPDNSRKIVKRFLVNNIGTSTIPLAFNIAPIEDAEERKKTELVRIGPSLEELENRIKTLEKKAGLAAP